MTIDFQALKNPFTNVSWRIGSKDKTGTKARFLAYIDARDVFDRLDQVIGVENWQNKQEIMSNGSMKCSLSIKINNEWITKEDGAGTRSTETEKSAYSDSIKRAAVLWGIGRYLYDVKTKYIPIDEYGNPTKEGQQILDKCLKDAEKGIYVNMENDNDDKPVKMNFEYIKKKLLEASTIQELQQQWKACAANKNRFNAQEIQELTMIKESKRNELDKNT